MRPATSDIGASSGVRRGFVTVSSDADSPGGGEIPDLRRVRREVQVVNRTCFSCSFLRSCGCGSLTLTISSASGKRL